MTGDFHKYIQIGGIIRQTVVDINGNQFLWNNLLYQHTQNPIISTNKILIVPLHGNMLIFGI